MEKKDDEPVGVLACTDFSKPSSVLRGKDAERFFRTMEENEREAAEKAKLPMTKDEAEKKLKYMKLIYDIEKNALQEKERKIKELENYISKLP